ncbi:Os06g0481450 [Oryza sativa Japonica Group]|uniref:Os06g0481450 protein n=1 Tax=Oryza sativa subsp. japonica TaxID=39947 RepID=A0A0P0WX27_ORYSJ|nr:Os06g0481450 [Oryza sativa Japonica Group]
MATPLLPAHRVAFSRSSSRSRASTQKACAGLMLLRVAAALCRCQHPAPHRRRPFRLWLTRAQEKPSDRRSLRRLPGRRSLMHRCSGFTTLACSLSTAHSRASKPNANAASTPPRPPPPRSSSSTSRTMAAASAPRPLSQSTR